MLVDKGDAALANAAPPAAGGTDVGHRAWKQREREQRMFVNKLVIYVPNSIPSPSSTSSHPHTYPPLLPPYYLPAKAASAAARRLVSSLLLPARGPCVGVDAIRCVCK